MPRKEIEFCKNIESGYCTYSGCTPSEAINKKELPDLFTGDNEKFENICVAKNGDAIRKCTGFIRGATNTP